VEVGRRQVQPVAEHPAGRGKGSRWFLLIFLFVRRT